MLASAEETPEAACAAASVAKNCWKGAMLALELCAQTEPPLPPLGPACEYPPQNLSPPGMIHVACTTQTALMRLSGVQP